MPFNVEDDQLQRVISLLSVLDEMCGNKRLLWDALASHKAMMVVSYNGGKGESMLRGWKSPEESIFNFFGM
jgi:hypothetical protein